MNLLEQALEAYLSERYDESISLFQEVLEYDRKNDTARQGLESALKQRKLKLQKAQAKEGPIYEAAERFFARGDYVGAMDRVRGILKRVPDHPKAKSLAKKIRKKVDSKYAKSKFQSSDWFYYKGVLAYLGEDWFQAAQAWEQVYAFNPDRVSLLSEIDLAKGNLEEQQRVERIALFQNVAWESLNGRKYKEAVDAWNEVLKLEPDNVEAQEGLKQAQEAESKDVVKRREEDIQSLSQKAMDAYIEREYAKSLELWKSVLEIDADNSLAQDYLKRIQSRSPSSSPYYRSSAGGEFYSGTYTPPAASSGYQRAISMLKDERYPEAIESLERYVSRNPSDGRAKDELDRAREKQRTLAERSYKEGLVAYSQGNATEAIKLWQSTLRIDPDYQKARQALVKALAESKRR